MKNWFKKLFAGMGIGVGAAIPGVSGAAIAVIFKIYESIIWAVNNVRKQFKRAVAILLPVLLGIVIAVIPCIILFDKALESFVFGTVCAFAGFLIGSLPSVKDEIKGEKITRNCKISFVIGVIFVLLLGVASIFLGKAINIDAAFSRMDLWVYFVLLPVGIAAAVALTVPGLSGSLILLIVGFYKPLLKYTVLWAKMMFSGDFSTTGQLFLMLFIFAIGVLIGVVLVSKIMKVLLAKYRVVTYSAILGFIIGSIAVLFYNYSVFIYYEAWAGKVIEEVSPALKPYVEIPLGIVILVAAAALSYLLVRLSRKSKQQEKIPQA